MSESATPFSAEIVRPAPLPVIVMFVKVAPVRRSAAAAFARAFVKYSLVPSAISLVVNASAYATALLYAVSADPAAS